MSAIFDALPGIDAPVGSISKSLAAMWADTGARGKPAPGLEDVTASQVNFCPAPGLQDRPRGRSGAV